MSEKHPHDCPVRKTLKVLGGKWAILVLAYLRETKRYGQLKRDIPDISEKMLIHTLRTLTANNYVSKKDYKTIPPKVEYSLAEKGKRALALIPILVDLAD